MLNGVVGVETGLFVAEALADAEELAIELLPATALAEADHEAALLLGDALALEHCDSVGDGDAEALSVAVAVAVALADAEAEAVTLAVALAVGLPEPEAPEEGEVGVADPEHGAGEAVESANPDVAGITSRAPIATVPVATAPTTETADRPLRARFGTVTSPNHRRSAVLSDHAPQRAHRPTVTNPASPGHPREGR